MRVLRAGGRYLEGREQRLWLTLACVVGLGGTGVMLVTQSPPVQWAGKGRLGERLVTDLLRRLPDDYWLVNDVMLGGHRGNIDHVLIGPCGVVVIETKRLAGRIRCWGDEVIGRGPGGARPLEIAGPFATVRPTDTMPPGTGAAPSRAP